MPAGQAAPVRILTLVSPPTGVATLKQDVWHSAATEFVRAAVWPSAPCVGGGEILEVDHDGLGLAHIHIIRKDRERRGRMGRLPTPLHQGCEHREQGRDLLRESRSSLKPG